jgi:hypothetical protein
MTCGLAGWAARGPADNDASLGAMGYVIGLKKVRNTAKRGLVQSPGRAGSMLEGIFGLPGSLISLWRARRKSPKVNTTGIIDAMQLPVCGAAL